jgi:ABC-2 type transport system ATP-binding protein
VSSGPPNSAQPDEISFGKGHRSAAEPAERSSAWAPDPGRYAPPVTPVTPVTPGTPVAVASAPPDAPAGAAPDTPAIATVGLTKRFQSGQLAVDDLSLEVPHGAVYGFLGPNGSGKTTTIRMLLGLVQPTSGTHQLLGVTMPGGANAVLPRVGSLVEGPAFYSFLSGRANLARCDAADRTADPRTAAARISEALERVGLTAAAAKHYRAYSLGMKQRLAIAAGLLRRRDLMILDEPTNGLDPQGTREVRSLIREIAADGTTVFVSSHLLAEVEQICSHVGVMRAGRLAFEGTLDQLRGTGAARITVTTPDAVEATSVLAGLGLADVQAVDGEVSAQLGDQPPEDINARLVHANVRVAGLATTRPSLEDLFVELTGEGFDVNG